MIAIQKTDKGLDMIKITPNMPIVGKRFVAIILEKGDRPEDANNLLPRLVESPDLESLLTKKLLLTMQSPKFGIDPFDSEFIEKNFNFPSESFRRNLFSSGRASQCSRDSKFRNIIQKTLHSFKHKINVLFRYSILNQNRSNTDL